MNNRRKLLVALGASALTASFGSFAQQQGKVLRVGFLSSGPGITPVLERFRLELGELGYVEGQNIAIEWRFAKGNADLLPKLATELVGLKVDCLVTNGANATIAARLATHTLPIVMGNSDDDPVRLGLIASLARPGGNVTGFTSISSELSGKRLQLLKETLPKLSRAAILFDPDSRPASAHIRATEAAARKLGVQLQSLEVRDPEVLEQAFQAAGKGHAQALIVVSGGLISNLQVRIVTLANNSRLPAMYTSRASVLLGGLMRYGADPIDQWRRVAGYIDRILKGAKPADLPVQQPAKFEFIINLKAAKQIGLTIPPGVIAQAEKVIE